MRLRYEDAAAVYEVLGVNFGSGGLGLSEDGLSSWMKVDCLSAYLKMVSLSLARVMPT